MILVAVGLITLAALVAAWRLLPVMEWARLFGVWARDLGPSGVAMIFAGYVLGNLLCLPGWPLTFVVALIYGWWALAISFTGGVIAALVAFWVGRTIARKPVQRLVNRYAKLNAVNSVAHDDTFATVLLARLTPVTPFAVENYVFGAANVRLKAYLLATAVGIVPGTILNVWLGVIGRTAVGSEVSAVRWAFLVVGLLVTFVLIVSMTRAAKKRLDSRTQGTKDRCLRA